MSIFKKNNKEMYTQDSKNKAITHHNLDLKRRRITKKRFGHMCANSSIWSGGTVSVSGIKLNHYSGVIRHLLRFRGRSHRTVYVARLRSATRKSRDFSRQTDSQPTNESSAVSAAYILVFIYPQRVVIATKVEHKFAITFLPLFFTRR